MTTHITSHSAVTITTTVEVTDHACHAVLTTALEGGIGYWAVARNIERDDDLWITRVDLAEEEDAPDNWHTMLAPDVRRGITALSVMINEATVHPNSEIGRGFADCLSDRDDGFAMADATLADAIVQCALFGKEIRYS